MSTDNTRIFKLPTFVLPSPMRMLRSLHRRLVIADGNRLEHEILEEQINRETDELLSIEREAKQAEAGIQGLGATWIAALADGQIDDNERRALSEKLLALKQPAHEHTHHIRQLL